MLFGKSFPSKEILFIFRMVNLVSGDRTYIVHFTRARNLVKFKFIRALLGKSV